MAPGTYFLFPGNKNLSLLIEIICRSPWSIFLRAQAWISFKIMYREYLPHQINPHNPIFKLERVTGFDSIKSDAGFVDASDQGGWITPISLALTLFCHVLLHLSELHDNSSQSKVNKSVGNCITHGSHEVAKQSVMLLWS